MNPESEQPVFIRLPLAEYQDLQRAVTVSREHCQSAQERARRMHRRAQEAESSLCKVLRSPDGLKLYNRLAKNLAEFVGEQIKFWGAR